MRKLPFLLALLAFGHLALASAPPSGSTDPVGAPNDTPSTPVATAQDGLVTIQSRGLDVRQVLHDLFGQAKRNYVVESVPRVELFLSLAGVDFEEALQIVCQVANLDVDLQNGIYFVTRRAPQTRPSTNAAPATRPRPQGKLPDSVLQKRVTTRFSKTDLRAIIADLGRQTGVRIEVAADVPRYLLNAFLINTSLKFGLDLITRATNLEYTFTNEQSIVIQPVDANRVTIVETAAAQRAGR